MLGSVDNSFTDCKMSRMGQIFRKFSLHSPTMRLKFAKNLPPLPHFSCLLDIAGIPGPDAPSEQSGRAKNMRMLSGKFPVCRIPLFLNSHIRPETCFFSKEPGVSRPAIY